MNPIRFRFIRVTDYLTKVTTRKCVNFISQSPTKDEITNELLQFQEKGTEVDERTAELYSLQGNIDITEVVVVDEMTQCKTCLEHNAKGKPFCACGLILQELSAGRTETLKKKRHNK